MKLGEKQKLLACNDYSNGDVMECNATDKEEDIDKDKDKEKDKKRGKDKKPTRHKYGEYKNVLLSDEDMEKLKTEFPTNFDERIERLSSYMASTGKSYKNHLATIRNWARKENVTPKAQNKPKNANDDFMSKLQSMYE